MSDRFDSVLVANRGEIAVRVLRSAAAAGYRTIAVYSEADVDAPHVAMADEAVLLGPAPVQDSYLDAERILDAARRTNAGAIHPGYGFLSENADFARACAAARIVFIGPSAEAIESMGNKAEAKRRMLDAGVPCIPGYQDTDQSDAALSAAAAGIGVPVMVKAAAGGGGRGMRLVEDLAQLPTALGSARSEAQNAFGSNELILERAVREPRHVEIQVFGDEHGNIVHLGERDCSVQRRHQKVVEEAPCPVMTDALRTQMGAAAVAAARSIAYVGAGTVEFLLDASGDFYFLEMNTRLQVEHPVTELVTGRDLVDLQLRVAQGQALGFDQADVSLTGHAIEVRLYAEDPSRDFLPATGLAQVWAPASGAGIRVDHGLKRGQEISPFYDPMLAKIIAHGPDRDTARRRLLRAVRETVILGLETNREFLIDVLKRPSFAAGKATTAFIEREFTAGVAPREPAPRDYAIAALLQHLHAVQRGRQLRLGGPRGLDGSLGARRTGSSFAYGEGDGQVRVRVAALGATTYRLEVQDRTLHLELASAADAALEAGRVRCAIDGVDHTVIFCFSGRESVTLQIGGHSATFKNELAFSAAERATLGSSGSVLAPMHGNLLSVLVAVGDRVVAGDDLAVMEAMKMEHRLSAGVDGTVTAIHGAPGDQFAAGALVLEIDARAEAASA